MAWAHLPDGGHLHFHVVTLGVLDELCDVFGLLDLIQVDPDVFFDNFDLLLWIDLAALVSTFSFSVYHCFII